LLAAAHVLELKEPETGQGERGTRWRVRIIDAGDAKSGVHYPLTTLHEAAPLFDGVAVIARSDEDHVQGRDTDPNKTVGWIRDPKAVPEGIDGTLELLDSEPIRTKLVEAWDRGKKDLLGLSIVAQGRAGVERDGTRTRMVAKAIHKVRSVDVVVHPAAGGRLLDLVAAEGGSPGGVHMFDQVLEFLEAEHPDLHKRLKARIDSGETLNEEDLLEAMREGTAALREADTTREPQTTPARTPAAQVGDPAMAEQITTLTEAVAGLTASVQAMQDGQTTAAGTEAAREAIRMERYLERRLATADPAVAEFVREDLPATFTESDVDEILARNAGRVARSRGFQSPVATPPEGEGSGRGSARVVMEEGERIRLAMDGFFAESDQVHQPSGARVPRYRSLRQMYGDLTGDHDVTGDFREADRLSSNFRGMNNPDLWEQYPGERMFAEAVTTATWASVYADTLRRALVKNYQENPMQQWRLLADVMSTPDYRPRHAIRMGGYGKLATVAEDSAYDAFTSPTDDHSTYSPTKYGGTDYLSREAILNDDVGAARRTPQRMATAAAYTLNWFVTSTLFGDNPNMTGTDTTALFVAGHNNVTASALSESSLEAARLAMRKQSISAPDADTTWDNATTRRIQVLPKYLWVPVDLEKLAYQLTATPVANHTLAGTDTNDTAGTPSTQTQQNPNVRSFINSWNLIPVVVPHWTDTDNWFLTADKSTGPLIEIAFVQGKENPDVFVQDMPTAGSMFTHDRMTFKLRHEYGGTPVDYRLAYGGIV
jgi:hypothetical protein